MRTSLLGCLLSLALCIPASAASAQWQTDFEAAKAQAKKENKLLLLNFTGSDWCGFCIKMKKETLDLQAFKEYAAKNFVLVEVDFPQRKKLPAVQQEANDALKKKYAIRGYPIFVVVDPSGKELGRQVGYLEGGPEAFIAKLEQMRKKAANAS